MLDLNYVPEKVVDVKDLSEKEWLKYRKNGIGGSDVAAILGISKWRTPLELYYDKTGEFGEKASTIDPFLADTGHAMETPIANLFARITGFKVENDTFMYRHPLYPFMLADFDRIAYDNENNRVGVEIKTTDEMNLYKWAEGTVGEDGRVPYDYELQVRHYLAVRNIDTWYVIVCWGFNKQKHMIVRINRDLDIEEDIINAEKEFWENNVVKKNPPKFSTLPTNSLKNLSSSLIQMPTVEGVKEQEPLNLDEKYKPIIDEYLKLKEKKSALKKEIDAIEERMNALAFPIMEDMGGYAKGQLETSDGENYYEVSFNIVNRILVDREKLNTLYPNVYQQVISESTSRPFSIKQKKIRKTKK